MRKTYFIGFIFIFSIISMYVLQLTYAKYKDNVFGLTDIQIARWDIHVNDESIINKQTLTSTIQPIFLGNEYVAEGVMAPGSEGYYDVVIDASNVDVSFSYTLTPEIAETSLVKDIVFTGYEINPGNTPNPTAMTNTISGDISLNDTTITVRIYILWDDSTSASMDNVADTNASISTTGKALINNNLSFVQTKKN